MKRIAIGGLHTECSSYSPLLQQRKDFTRLTGDDLIREVPVDFAALGLEPVPIFHDRSVPGGPVAAEVFEAQRSAFLEALGQAGPLDGALLLMHGAMFVPGVADPEGDFLSAVRAALGPEAILAASFDLHGQMTQAVADSLDAFAAYRTAPHVDVPETHARAARMLARALRGGPRPAVHWRAVPLLVPGEMSSTFVEPCQSLYAALPGHDEEAGIWDANLMIGYVWADTPRATAAAVVTATEADRGAKTADTIARAYWEARHALCFDMEALPLGAALDAVGPGPAILADSGDNPTAGGVGDRADVLAALLERGQGGAVLAGIADPTACAALKDGARAVTIGGSLGGGGPRVTAQVDDVRFRDDCAVVETDGLLFVLTNRRRPFHHLSDFAALDIDLERHALVVVKSGYLSPDLRVLPRRQVMALTDGAVCQDLSGLENRHRPDGTYPFAPRQ